MNYELIDKYNPFGDNGYRSKQHCYHMRENMMFTQAYQKMYCEYEQSWSEETSEYGLFAIYSFGKHTPEKRKRHSVFG